jgi:hypothetical protein
MMMPLLRLLQGVGAEVVVMMMVMMMRTLLGPSMTQIALHSSH